MEGTASAESILRGNSGGGAAAAPPSMPDDHNESELAPSLVQAMVRA